MTGQTLVRRLIVGLCLVLFQAQSAAALTMSCLHKDEGVDPVNCPFHASGKLVRGVADDRMPDQGAAAQADARPSGATHDAGAQIAIDAESSLFDCPKCTLHLALQHAVIDSHVTVTALPRRNQALPLPRIHFYSFVPELSTKPPMSGDL